MIVMNRGERNFEVNCFYKFNNKSQHPSLSFTSSLFTHHPMYLESSGVNEADGIESLSALGGLVHHLHHLPVSCPGPLCPAPWPRHLTSWACTSPHGCLIVFCVPVVLWYSSHHFLFHGQHICAKRSVIFWRQNHQTPIHNYYYGVEPNSLTTITRKSSF